MAGLRRSEVSALRWTDVVDAIDGGEILVTVRRSKTNQAREVHDVRFVKDGVARAVRTYAPPRVRSRGKPSAAVVGADDRLAVPRLRRRPQVSRAGWPRILGGSGSHRS